MSDVEDRAQILIGALEGDGHSEDSCIRQGHPEYGEPSLDADRAIPIITAALSTARAEGRAEATLAAAEALESAHTVMVHDARDWSLSSRDAWLYGLLVGWDDECLAEMLARHPQWKPEGIERLKRLRAGIAAIYDIDQEFHKTVAKKSGEPIDTEREAGQ